MKMKSWHLILIGLMCGLLATGLILLVSSPSRGQPVILPPAPTQAPIAVDVSGAVHNPGVYFLNVGSRVEDAIQAAGGFLPEAFTESINLAAALTDGSKVLVPIYSEGQTSEQQKQDAVIAETIQTSFPININTASKETLMLLPGIGETKAQAIIDFRSQHGPFTEIEQIMLVSGIGEVTFENLRDLITIY